MSAVPATEYRARHDARRALHTTLAARDARFSYARLAVFGAEALIGALAFRGLLGWWPLALPAVAFGLLMRRHEAVIRARVAAARATLLYERGLARLEDRWAGGGEPGDRFRDDDHPYANDLDLFGRGSLFELLSIARTRMGEEILADWLKTPAGIEDIRERQEAVEELAPRLDLREELALAGAEVRAGVDGDALMAWAEGTSRLGPSWLRGIAAALTALAVLAGYMWATTGNAAPFFAVVAIEILFSVPQRTRVRRALHAADGPARDLDILANVLGRLERQRFTSRRLMILRNQLDTGGVAPSLAIARLHRLVELHDWQHNQFFAPVAAVLLWGTHLAWAIERWRAIHGTHVRTWLRAVGEFEALTSLSAYRYEHPEDPFPEVHETGAAAKPPARFDATGLGHPLLPAARMIRNDVHLADETRLLVISGSNMSGKSTLLRTVGINAVLALAGASVRASALRMTPLAIGATLRIQDSLQEGRSRFYAEITRIRQISDLTRGPLPVMFLLDELLHGTNSHDRLVGASGVLRSLLDRGAIGLITTHDLALADIVNDLAPRAANTHFEDRLEHGEIRFDYRMKPGPVTRSNAVALMRAIGLEVDAPE